jgi:8-oxo-dGTP pyrophosphatase MutT (NUDIX family)
MTERYDEVGPRFSLVPAAFVFLRRRGEVLLQLRQGTGYMDDHWAAGIAGHVEAGESVFEAARREGREELGIEVGELIPATVMHRTLAGGGAIEQRVDFYFTSEVWTGEPAIQEPDKAADLGWFPLGALPAPLVPHEATVLDGLRAGVLPSVTTYGFAGPRA